MVGKHCADIEPYFSSYIDGSLDDEAKSLVEKELQTCAACQAKLALMQAVKETAEHMPEIEVSDAFKTSLHERLLAEQAAKETRKKPFVWSRVSGFVAVAAVLFLSVITLSSLPQHPELTSEVLTKQQTVETKTEDEEIKSSVLNGNKEQEINQGKSATPTESGYYAAPKSILQEGERASDSIEPADAAMLAAEDDMPASCSIEATEENDRVSQEKLTIEDRDIIHYYFLQESFLEAQNILCAYGAEGEVWAVPTSEAELVEKTLKQLTGYKKAETKTEAIQIELKDNENVYIVLHVAP